MGSRPEVEVGGQPKIEVSNGVDTDTGPPMEPDDCPLFYGYGKRIVDSGSSEFEKVAEMIHSLEGGDLHELRFLIKPSHGGFEASNPKGGTTCGWSTLLEFDEDGNPSILKREVWRH